MPLAMRLPRFSLEEMNNVRHEYLATAHLVPVDAELPADAVYRNPLPD